MSYSAPADVTPELLPVEIGPKSNGLPTLSSPPLTDDEFGLLMSIMDTIIPSIERDTSKKPNALHISEVEYNQAVDHLRRVTVLDLADTTAFDNYLAERPSQIPLFQEILKRSLAGLPVKNLQSLRSLLLLMNNRLTGLPLTGYLTPFHKLPIHNRTAVLQSWRSSSLPPLRLAFKQFGVIAKHVYLRSSSAFNTLSGFPSIPKDWSQNPTYPFQFLQFQASESPCQLITDVVIVGSGCGAGVVANKIAAAGYQVVVVEKGYHFSAESFPMRQSEAFFHLFEQGGQVASEDGSLSVTAGSCFGGGGTVNWSACLQTDNMVRNEWANEHNLPFFTSSGYQACLDRVSDHMGVSDRFINQNHGNSTLLEGGRKLGFNIKSVPQNTKHCEHHDGYCALGCWKGEKQGPVNGWFPDAAKHGARFIEGFKVEKVLFNTKRGKKIAGGVTGVWTSRNGVSTGGENSSERISQRITIKAKIVVVAAGSLWSPIILQNSGLKNKHIGRNLHLHPTSFVCGIFKEDVRPWEGGILTSVVTSFDNLDGKGHGVRLERGSMMPSMTSIQLNWTSGFDYKMLLSKYRHMEIYIAITRDKSSGSVFADPNNGNPRLAYTPSPDDLRHNLIGMAELANILYVQGALEIHPALPGLRPFIRSEDNSFMSADVSEEPQFSVSDINATDTEFQKWLKELKSHGNKVPDTPFSSAHQMSSCRMSSSQGRGVVDPHGKVWGCEGLFVADGSILPSASGVNPMITIMAICDWIGSNIVRELQTNMVEISKI